MSLKSRRYHLVEAERLLDRLEEADREVRVTLDSNPELMDNLEFLRAIEASKGTVIALAGVHATLASAYKEVT